MSSESLKRSRSKVSPVNEGDIDKRPCIDTLHESFSSLGDSDTAYNETTILEPDSESEVCRLHSTVLDPAGSDDPDQSRQEMSIRDSLKEALKDPAVVQVLTNAITSSLRSEIRTLREALERKEEKIAELQDRVDSLEQYSRRNNVRISGIPDSTSDVENTDAIVKKVGEVIGMTITDEMIDRSHRVGKPGKMGRDVLVKFTSYRYKHLIMRARSGLKNKDAARLGLSPAGAVRQPESAAAAAAMPIPSPAGRVYVNDDLTRERSRVAARARQLKRDKKIKDTWVRDGEIYVKKNDDSINKLSTSRQLDVFGS